MVAGPPADGWQEETGAQLQARNQVEPIGPALERHMVLVARQVRDEFLGHVRHTRRRVLVFPERVDYASSSAKVLPESGRLFGELADPVVADR